MAVALDFVGVLVVAVCLALIVGIVMYVGYR